MAVNGRFLFNSGERLDVPDLISASSYVGADFKYLINGFTGSTTPYIVRGFEVIDPAASIGSNSISIQVAESLVYCPGISTGSFFQGLEEGNANAEALVPVLRKNATNYVYLTLTMENRARDVRAFWDPDANDGAGAEFTQDVNTQQALRAEVNVSTSTFPTNTIAICKVVYGATSITSIQDCRNLFFRLGSGGPNPDSEADYSFRELPTADYARSDPTQIMTSTSSPNAFQGGDKNIRSLKEWMDVVMTRFHEISGGTTWYSSAHRDSVKLVYGPIVSLTDNFEWDGVDQLEWESLAVTFDNSAVYFNNIVDDVATLDTDGQALYVDIDRTNDAVPLTAQVGDLLDMGDPVVAGSRFIIAWRIDGEIYTRDRNYEVGRALAVATTSTEGVVRLNQTPASAFNPVVVSVMTNGRIQVTSTGGNAIAATFTGNGTGAGVQSTGGSSSGNGLVGFGGATAGVGVTGTGAASGHGVVGVGGGTTGVGGSFTAMGGNSIGAIGVGFGTGAGLQGTGGSGNARGVVGFGSGNEAGIVGTGGATGPGVVGVAQGGSDGVQGSGQGAGKGVLGTAGATGVGGAFTGGVTSGTGVTGSGGTGGGLGGSFTGTAGFGGVVGQGQGAGVGGTFTGGASGSGVIGIASASATGVYGTSVSATGVYGESFAGGYGVIGASASGIGIKGIGGTNGAGVEGVGAGSGAGVTTAGGATGSGLVTVAGGSPTANTNTRYAVDAGAGHVKLSGGNPTSTTAFTNTSTPGNQEKCWGILVSAGSTVDVAAGFNIASVTVDSTKYTVTMASAMSGLVTGGTTSIQVYPYMVVGMGAKDSGNPNPFNYVGPTGAGATFYTLSLGIVYVSATVFTISLYDAQGARQALDPAETSYRVDFRIVGLQ